LHNFSANFETPTSLPFAVEKYCSFSFLRHTKMIMTAELFTSFAEVEPQVRIDTGYDHQRIGK
jgi:hypothetical protein